MSLSFYLNVILNEGLEVARTIAISKPIITFEALLFCEVEVYGYPFVKSESVTCNLFITNN